MKLNFLFYVSFILMALLVQEAYCDDDAPAGVEDMEDNEDVVSISVQKAKREGWLPWYKWYDEPSYFDWKKTVRHYFEPLDHAGAFMMLHAPNITELSTEKYDYYMKGGSKGYGHQGHSHLILMGSTHRNETMWVAHEVQVAWDNYTMYDPDTNGNRSIEFSYVEPRYDEPIALGFNIRFWPSIYFIDGETNGTVYQWDKWEYINNETLRDWILNKEYLNSTIQFPTPRIADKSEYWILYSIKWFRTNFGSRFCKQIHKAPVIEKYIFFPVCDFDKTDMLR